MLEWMIRWLIGDALGTLAAVAIAIAIPGAMGFWKGVLLGAPLVLLGSFAVAGWITDYD